VAFLVNPVSILGYPLAMLRGSEKAAFHFAGLSELAHDLTKIPQINNKSSPRAHPLNPKLQSLKPRPMTLYP
jgi:hypothetical protein